LEQNLQVARKSKRARESGEMQIQLSCHLFDGLSKRAGGNDIEMVACRERFAEHCSKQRKAACLRDELSFSPTPSGPSHSSSLKANHFAVHSESINTGQQKVRLTQVKRMASESRKHTSD